MPNNSNIVAIQYPSYAYVSCYREAKLSFQMYTDPFQWPIWSAIGITLVVCSVFVDLFTKFILKLNRSTSFLFFLSSILEETSFIPRELEKRAAFKISIGPCILVTMILSQASISLVINGLNAPFPSKKYDTIDSIQSIDDDYSRVDKI